MNHEILQRIVGLRQGPAGFFGIAVIQSDPTLNVVADAIAVAVDPF